MSVKLAGGASTQSRGRRPLPAGAVKGTTIDGRGVRELVEFERADGSTYKKNLLSWVGGQWGGLWGAPNSRNLPVDIYDSWMLEAPGSYGHVSEYELAEELGLIYSGLLTSNDLGARFFCNGGDACSAAVRAARAVTGKSAIATYGYHGAHLDFAHAPNTGGVPPEIVALHRRFEWGDILEMTTAADGAACIMVEVPPVMEESALLFLKCCRELADRLRIPLIIDDVVCGFRLALGGSAERYGVKPDVVILGKAMSAIGGVSAVLGREDIVGALDGAAFYSTTFGGHPMLCGVAAATARWLREHRAEVYGLTVNFGGMQEYKIGHLHKIGAALQDGFNALGLNCVGQPERSVLKFPTDAEWLSFCSAMIGRGVMIHRPQFSTLVHALADVETTLAAAREVLGNGK